MNIVFRCVDPGLGPPHPLLGSVHFCGILYIFEIPSVWSTNTQACKRALKHFSFPIFMIPSHINGSQPTLTCCKKKKNCFASPFTQLVPSFEFKKVIFFPSLGLDA